LLLYSSFSRTYFLTIMLLHANVAW
jgi:hypothetical protein